MTDRKLPQRENAGPWKHRASSCSTRVRIILLVALLAAWIATSRISVMMFSMSPMSLCWASGGVKVTYIGMGVVRDGSPCRWVYTNDPFWFGWMPRLAKPTSAWSSFEIFIPFWIPILIIGIQMCRQRRPVSQYPVCAQCSYSLRGNVSGLCPECGYSCEQKSRSGT